MDNCAIYRNPTVQEMCLKRRVLLEYLPPYCSFLTPIDGIFADLKAHIRRHYRNHIVDNDLFESFLIQAIKEVGRGEKAQKSAIGHF